MEDDNKALQALESIGWGRYNLYVFLQCGFAWTTYDYWFAGITFIIEGCKQEWHLRPLYVGIVGAFFQLGMLLGSFFWGYVCDKYGRIRFFKLTIFIAFLSTLSMLFAVNPYMVAGSLTFLGFALSGEQSLGGIVFYEFCPPSKRHYFALLAFFFCIGSTACALVAYLASVFNHTEFYTWRIVVLFGCIFKAILVVFRLFMKESPSFLFSQNDIDGAELILNEVSMKNRKKEFKFINYINTDPKGKVNSSNWSMEQDEYTLSKILSLLFGKQFAKITIVFCLVFSIQMLLFMTFGYCGFLNFMPEFLSDYSTSTAYIIIFLQQVSGFPGAVLGTFTQETRLGRKYTVIISCVMTGLFFILFNFTSGTAAVFLT
jgi:MFS family permease